MTDLQFVTKQDSRVAITGTGLYVFFGLNLTVNYSSP